MSTWALPEDEISKELFSRVSLCDLYWNNKMDKLKSAMKPVTRLVGLNGIRTQEHAIALHDALQQSWRHLVGAEFRNRMGSESMGKHWLSETRREEKKPIWPSLIAVCRHEVVWSNVRWIVSNFGRSDFMFFNLWQDLLLATVLSNSASPYFELAYWFPPAERFLTFL